MKKGGFTTVSTLFETISERTWKANARAFLPCLVPTRSEYRMSDRIQITLLSRIWPSVPRFPSPSSPNPPSCSPYTSPETRAITEWPGSIRRQGSARPR